MFEIHEFWNGPRPPAPETVPETPLATVELSARARSGLRQCDITTLRELVGTTWLDLFRPSRIGRKTVQEIQAVVTDRGYHLQGQCTSDNLVPDGTYPYPDGAVVSTRRCVVCGDRTAKLDVPGTGSERSNVSLKKTPTGPPELFYWKSNEQRNRDYYEAEHRLQKAAPDLLAACKAAQTTLRDVAVKPAEDLQKTLVLLEAAIAKTHFDAGPGEW